MVKKNNLYKTHLVIVTLSLVLAIVLNIWATNLLFTKAKNIAELSAEVKLAKIKLEDINEAEKMIKQKEQEISILETYYFNDINLPPILEQIERLGRDNNLEIRVTYLDDNGKPEIVSATIFAFGDFNNHYAFYKKLYSLPFMLDVSMLEMEYGEIPSEYLENKESIETAWGVNYLIEISGYLSNKEILEVNKTENEESDI